MSDWFFDVVVLNQTFKEVMLENEDVNKILISLLTLIIRN